MPLRTNALSRLVDSLMKPTHDKRPSIETFPDLDPHVIAEEMRLDDIGRERGEKGEPPTTSSAMDEVEIAIIERIDSEKKKAHSILEDEIRTYGERLAALDFEGRFGAIRQALPACIGEFKGEVAKGRLELHRLFDEFKVARDELEDFRSRNRLVRAARTHDGSWLFLKVAILVTIFLLEVVLNGYFLSKGSDQGLIGGVTEAISFAALNVFVAVFTAVYLVIQIHHLSLLRRLVGLMSFILYLGFAVALNLALAHYREVTGRVLEGAGEAVFSRLLSDPFGLTDLNSWIFAAIGFCFSVIAFTDGLYMRDHYPGYSGVKRRYDKRRLEFQDGRAALIDQLGDIRDAYRDEFDEITRDLAVRRQEHDSILHNRARLISAFDHHQDQLEKGGQLLFAIYRDANRAARETKPPRRFSTAFKLDRVHAQAILPGEYRADELRAKVEETERLLTEEARAIHFEFQRALAEYEGLDKGVTGHAGGEHAAAAA